MRVLITCLSAHGHLFPMISTGWALRAAGHEVLIATCGGLAPVERTGLPGVDIVPDLDMGLPEGAEVGREPTPDTPEDPEHPWARFFAFMAETMIEGLVRVVESWRPDVVVHEETLLIGSLAAIHAGIPSVAHGIGLAHNLSGAEAFFRPQLPLFRRYGVRGLPAPSAVIDVSPPSMGSVQGAWPMRYLPYNGSGMLPGWLFTPRDRPRIAVTLGTFTPHLAGLGPVERVVAAAEQTEAEFVLALDGADISALGELPPTVRVTGWVPLNSLLATCAAVIHHGGAGTTMTAIDAGIPQLVVPRDGDQPLNAAAVHERGLGLLATPEEVDAKLVDALLHDPDLRAAAGQVRAELHAMPLAATVVRQIELLVQTKTVLS